MSTFQTVWIIMSQPVKPAGHWYMYVHLYCCLLPCVESCPLGLLASCWLLTSGVFLSVSIAFMLLLIRLTIITSLQTTHTVFTCTNVILTEVAWHSIMSDVILHTICKLAQCCLEQMHNVRPFCIARYNCS